MLNDLHSKPQKTLVFPQGLEEMHKIQTKRDNFFQNTLASNLALNSQGLTMLRSAYEV